MMTSHRSEMLAGLLDMPQLALIGEDSAGRIQLWSRGAEAILGWLEEELLGQPAPPALRLHEIPTGESELNLSREDGIVIDVASNKTFWKDPEGKVQGTLTLITDIGQRHAIEKKLDTIGQEILEVKSQEREAHARAKTERRFRELLEAAPDAIIEVDRDGRIVLLNLVTEKLFGYKREELLGQPVEVLVPEEFAGHARHRAGYWEHPVTRPMGSGLALRGRRKDGSTFAVEISLSPVKSEDGFRVTAVIRDISERKEAEDRFRELQQTYMRELESRNREVERANQLKSEFLASMSHELRTPLHTIIGFSELLGEQMEGPLNEKQLRFTGHIHADSLHLLALINDILDISKIESGRLELQRETFDLAKALEETLSSIRPQAIAKSISIATDISVPHAISADRLRVKQILFNLLSNALKFTPAGGQIQIRAVAGAGFLEVSVSDTGIGIPKEQQEAVFEKFYQVGATTKGVREGTGLGLAITKALVTEHRGQIWLESEPGKGSRFTFTIAFEDMREEGLDSGR